MAYLLSLLPLIQWNLGFHVDPGRDAMILTGTWAIYFLALSLLVTPLKRKVNLVKYRRSLGLQSALWATLHFLVWLAFYGFDIKLFVIVGFLGLCIMLALAITSPFTIRKRMHPKAWKKLHKLSYLLGALAVVHVLLDIRGDLGEAIMYVIAYIFLMFLRGVPRTRLPR